MMNEKELLEWYLAAGVDAICGDVPGCLQQKAPPRERPTAVGETASRPAITDLAQMSLRCGGFPCGRKRGDAGGAAGGGGGF